MLEGLAENTEASVFCRSMEPFEESTVEAEATFLRLDPTVNGSTEGGGKSSFTFPPALMNSSNSSG